jgi:hypothetical protein
MRGSIGMPLANEIEDESVCGHGVAVSMHFRQDLVCPAQPCLHSRKFALHFYRASHNVRKPEELHTFRAYNTLPCDHHSSFCYPNMVVQQTGVRLAQVTCFNSPPQLDRNVQPQQDSLPLLDGVITADPDDAGVLEDELKREAERQTLFQKIANGILGSPNGYREVQVLIIRWDESIDQFKGHTKEVRKRKLSYPDRLIVVSDNLLQIERLEKIFTKDFGYNCRVARLKNHRDPQVGLNMAILKHIEDHDNENTLLIVYYTGHGAQVVENSDRRLELSAYAYQIHGGPSKLTEIRTESFSANNGYAPTAFWDEAEKPLRRNTSSDTLVLLDCCYASTAGLKGRNEEFRTYQLLAASATEGYTTGPGEKSFTTALCDSLEELLEESKGESFPVIKLSERISTKRTQHSAVMWDRLGRYERSVGLGRLVRNAERESSFQREIPEKASLLLRLSLGTNELSDAEIDRLARQLPKACRQAKIHVRRMEWVKMKHRNPKEVFRKAVKATMRMNSNRRQSTPGKVQRRRSSQEHKKRTHSETSAVPEPKRIAREGSSTSVETGVSGCVVSPVSLEEEDFVV